MPNPSRIHEVIALLPEPEAATWPKSKRGRRGTVKYMAEVTGMAEPTICKHMRTLKEQDRAHIGTWNRTVGNPAAMWVSGPGEDAPRPMEKTPAYYSKRCRKNIAKAVKNALAGKEYDKRYTKHVRLAEADITIQSVRAKPVQWFSALGVHA